MKKTLLPLGLCAVLVLISCQTINFQASYSKSIDFSNGVGKEYTIVNHFAKEMRVGFTLGGLIALDSIQVDKVISDEMDRYHGDAFLNLKIKDELSATDYLINLGLTAGGYLAGVALGGYSSSSTYLGTGL